MINILANITAYKVTIFTSKTSIGSLPTPDSMIPCDISKYHLSFLIYHLEVTNDSEVASRKHSGN